MRIATRQISFVFFLAVGSLLSLNGQTPPCGVAVVQSSDGPKTDERFLPAPPEVVKQDFLKVLPALGYIVRKNEGLHIEAIQDIRRVQNLRQTSVDLGGRGIDAGIISGPVSADIREATQAGIQGAHLSITFKTGFLGHKGSNAGSLAAETECLVKLLGTNDPSKNPRGDAMEKTNSPAPIKVPEGAPLKVLLFAPVYSKDYKKNNIGQPIQFEVAQDVVVDSVIVFRRGALALGHLTDFKSAGAYGRHAALEFTFDTAVAVDGQQIPVTGEVQQIKGGHTAAKFEAAAERQPVLGLLMKGADVLIRAGTEYDLQVSRESSIQTGAN